MELLKKRRTAVTVFVAVVVVFSLIGCHRSLTKEIRRVESLFFVVEHDDARSYYTCPGDQLEAAVKYAARLETVISGHVDDEVYTALDSARTGLATALELRDISDIYDANEALKTAVSAVEEAAAGLDLSDSYDSYDDIIAGFDGAQNTVEKSGYNDSIDAFRADTLQRFPTGLLRIASLTRLPEKFA